MSFNRQVIEYMGLITDQIFMRVLGAQFPCVLYSASMMEAKVVASLESLQFETLRSANNLVSLRFAFTRMGKSVPLSFFVTAKVTGFSPYNRKKPNINFVNLTYTQRPPDDLIRILGQLLDINVNSKKRKEERISLDEITARKLGMDTKNAVVKIEGRSIKCIIRDLSFSGAKILINSLGGSLQGKPIALELDFDDTDELITVPGRILRSENLKDREEIVTLAVQFEESGIPISYKTKINQFFS